MQGLYRKRNPLKIMSAKSLLKFLGEKITNSVYPQTTQVRNLSFDQCYDLLPVQYTGLTHQLKKLSYLNLPCSIYTNVDCGCLRNTSTSIDKKAWD